MEELRYKEGTEDYQEFYGDSYGPKNVKEENVAKSPSTKSKTKKKK